MGGLVGGFGVAGLVGVLVISGAVNVGVVLAISAPAEVIVTAPGLEACVTSILEVSGAGGVPEGNGDVASGVKAVLTTSESGTDNGAGGAGGIGYALVPNIGGGLGISPASCLG